MRLRIIEAQAWTSRKSPLAKGKESFAVQSRGDGTLAPDQGKQLYINLTSIDAKERVAKTTDEDGPDVLTNRCVNGTISNHILRHLRGVTERYGFIQRAMTSMINHNQDWRKPFHVNINPGANLQLVFWLMWPLTSNFFTSTEPINARELFLYRTERSRKEIRMNKNNLSWICDGSGLLETPYDSHPIKTCLKHSSDRISPRGNVSHCR